MLGTSKARSFQDDLDSRKQIIKEKAISTSPEYDLDLMLAYSIIIAALAVVFYALYYIVFYDASAY